ncbi:MAG: CoA-transferase [Anaerolineales bacterium]
MSKLLSLSDAIRRNVHDGDTLYAAGFTHLIPFAAGHEIIRQGLRDLVLARATPDLIYDQMVAAGCCVLCAPKSKLETWNGRSTHISV